MAVRMAASKVRGVADGLMIHFLNHVTALQAGIRSLAVGIHTRHDHSGGGRRQAKLPRRAGGNIFYRNTLQSVFALAVIRLSVVGGFRGQFRQRHGKRFVRAIAEDLDFHGGAGAHQRNMHTQFRTAVDRLAVDGQNDVALLNTGSLRRAVRGHVANQGAGYLRRVERLSDRGRDFLRHHAKIGTGYFSVLDDLIHHIARHTNRNGKTDPLVPFRTIRQNGGVDTDQFAALIDQGAARIAGVDGRIGLDEIFVVFNAEVGAALGADDAHGDGLADAEGVADGEHIVADLHLVGIADGDGVKVAGVDLHNSDIGLRHRCPRHELCIRAYRA